MKLNEVLDIRTPFINKVVEIVDKISRKKNSPIDFHDKQAIIASLQHNVKKHGESLDVILDVIEKVFRKRMSKAGRYDDYHRASDALRQSFIHAFKDKGVTEMKFNEIFGTPTLTEVRDRGIPDGDDYEERKLLDQEDKERRLMTKTPVQPVTTANANNMTKKQMEEYDLYLVVDKKTFGFNVGGTFLVTGMKYKPDGGLMVKVPKQQRGSGEIFIPSNRSGTKFILSKGPDSGPSVPVDTHVAITLFNRGINEGKECKTPSNNKTERRGGNGQHFTWKVTLKDGKVKRIQADSRENVISQLSTDDKIKGGYKIVKEDLTESHMSELEAALPRSWKNSEVVWGGRGKKTNAKIVIVNHDGNKFTVMRLGDNGWEVKSKDHPSLETAQVEIKNMVN